MKKFFLLALCFTFVLSVQMFPAFADEASAVSATNADTSNIPSHIFVFEKDEIPEIYLTNQNTPMYLRIPDTNEKYAELVKTFADTKAVRMSSYNPDSGIDAGFFVSGKNGRNLVNLLPGNILTIDGVPYGTTTKQYQRLLDLGNHHYKDAKPVAQWCAFMNYRNIVKVSVSMTPGETPRDIPVENILAAAKDLHELDGSNGAVYFPKTKELENWKGRIKIEYTFENGLKYSVYTNKAYLFIESDGMSYACQYMGNYSAYVAKITELATKPSQSKTASSK